MRLEIFRPVLSSNLRWNFSGLSLQDILAILDFLAVPDFLAILDFLAVPDFLAVLTVDLQEMVHLLIEGRVIVSLENNADDLLSSGIF